MNLHATTLRNTRSFTAIGAIALLIAACSGAGQTTGPTNAATQAAPSTGATASPAASAGGAEIEVELGNNDNLGQFLVGEDGKTLYLFTPDSATKSVCNAECAAAWPPLTLEDGETVTGGEGVTGTFTTITRDDGTKQAAYNGHPLYYYAGDKAAGDVNGQGLNSKWYVVGADGNAIMGTSTGGKGTY